MIARNDRARIKREEDRRWSIYPCVPKNVKFAAADGRWGGTGDLLPVVFVILAISRMFATDI